LIEQARWVVVIAGNTEGLDWEYRQLASHRAWRRLVLVFPPVGEAEKRYRWSRFRQASKENAVERDAEWPTQALLARLDERGVPIFVRCKWDHEETFYRLALSWALSPSVDALLRKHPT
jgi:hypothetical protein